MRMKKGPISKQLLHRLYYKDRLSMQDISRSLDTTFPTVEYWMKKHNFPRRSCSESGYVKLNSNGDPFKIKKKLNKKEKELLLIGLALFWSEGSKAIKGSVQLVNLDYRMLQLFVRFLRRICRISEDRLRLYVRVYKTFNREKARRYWSRKLKMSSKKVFVYPHTDGRSKVDKQWSKYGIATLQFHNIKLWEWLNKSIEHYLEKTLSN
jgi:hypothetical protein